MRQNSSCLGFKWSVCSDSSSFPNQVSGRLLYTEITRETKDWFHDPWALHHDKGIKNKWELEGFRRAFSGKCICQTKSAYKKGWWDYCFLYLSKSIAPRSSNLCASKDTGVVITHPTELKQHMAEGQKWLHLESSPGSEFTETRKACLFWVVTGHMREKKTWGFIRPFLLRSSGGTERLHQQKNQGRIWCPYWLYEILQMNTLNRNASSQASAEKRSP